MNLVFESLTLSNIGSYTKPATLSFDRPAGLYFIRGKNNARPRMGPNGVGKSTLWRATVWIIYGRTTSGLRGPDLEPWAGKRGIKASLTLLCDNHRRVITRTTQPNRLLIDDTDASQEQVDALIGMSIECFCNTIVWPQDEPLFLDLPPRSKLQLLSDALNLTRWEFRSKRASERTNDLVGDETTLNTKLDAAKTQFVLLDANYLQTNKLTMEWEGERQKDLEDKEARLKAQVEKADAAQLAHDNAKLEQDKLGFRLKELRVDLAKQNNVVADAKLAEREAGSVVTAYNNDRSELQQHLDNLIDTCPTCGQSLKVKDINKHRAELRAKLAGVTKNYKNAVAQRDAAYTKLGEAIRKAKEIENDITQADKLYDNTNSALHRYTEQLAEARTFKENLREQITNLKAQTNPHRDQAHKFKQQLNKVGREIDELQPALARLATEIECTRYWIKGFRDVSLFLIEEVLAEVELTCNAMLPEVGLDGWEMKFNVERETATGSIQRGLNVSVLSPSNTKPVRWECWSGGEGQRLRTIGALALSEVLLSHAGVSTNIEVLDEPTQHLSSEGTRDLCTFLADRARQIGRQTWWTDHQIVESSQFSGMITIVNGENGSYIEG